MSRKKEMAEMNEPLPIQESTAELPVEENLEELLISYINKQKSEEVELNDFLAKSYGELEDSLIAKKSFQLIKKLSFEGKIKMSNTNWNDLASHYYDDNGKSKKYLLSDIKILAKK